MWTIFQNRGSKITVHVTTNNPQFPKSTQKQQLIITPGEPPSYL